MMTLAKDLNNQTSAPSQVLDQQSISFHFKNLIENKQEIKHVFAAAKSTQLPDLAWKLNSPRFDLIISGSIVTHYSISNEGHVQQQLNAGDVLYMPACAWSQPIWQHQVTMLSFIFSNHKVGISLQQWNGEQFDVVQKKTLVRQQEKVGDSLLQALNTLCLEPTDYQTKTLIMRALLSHISTMGEAVTCLPTRQQALFQRISQYIDNHYNAPLTRETLSETFYLSPNYISHIFQQQGQTSFKEYLNNQRVINAKELLFKTNNRIKKISHQCGFSDNNYFCRLFKHKTGVTPSQYRASRLRPM